MYDSFITHLSKQNEKPEEKEKREPSTIVSPSNTSGIHKKSDAHKLRNTFDKKDDDVATCKLMQKRKKCKCWNNNQSSQKANIMSVKI